jgi:hypothetical protein
MLLSVACQDTLRNRRAVCASDDAACMGMNALSAEQFRSKLIAHVTVDVMVGKTQMVFVSNDMDEDRDAESDFVCNLSVEAGAQFNYKLSQGKLILNNGMTNLTFTKKSGVRTELAGAWVMVTEDAKVQTVLEMNFRAPEEVFISKTCNIR